MVPTCVHTYRNYIANLFKILKYTFLILRGVMPSFDLSLREEIVGTVPPPPGVTPNFIDPPSLQHIILITNITLSFFSTFFVALRLYTTGLIIHSVGVDDCKYSILA